MTQHPLLSIVMVVHDMPRQAMVTLSTLLPPYQRDIRTEDYEILVVENLSEHNLDPEEVRAASGNVRYLCRDEPTESPAAACNYGVGESSGDAVCLMVDGARMVTPGLVRTTLNSLHCFPSAVLSAPGYHLGHQLQRDPAQTGYDEDSEQKLLAGINWPADGYRLFDVAVLSGSCSNGFLLPMAESNFLTMPRRVWEELGGVDTRFRSTGGGFVNLDLYRRALEHTGGRVIVTPGEGTFHQFHGGATTGRPGLDRQRLLIKMSAEYARLRGQDFLSPRSHPILFGEVSEAAVRFLLFSAQRMYEEADA